MSQIRGGRADKLGNAFERLWVVSLALDVVDGHATAIKWEPLGPEGAGVECLVSRPDGIREKHQCKIENGLDARWRAAHLDDVLNAAKVHLEADHSSRFIFVSRDPVRILSDLAERARSCDGSGKDFLAHCLTSEEHRREYQVLCARWMLDPNREHDAQVAIGLLCRMQFERGFWEPSERHLLYRHAESIAEGEGKEIVTLLGSHLGATLGNTRHTDDLRALLRENGFAPLNLTHDHRVPDGIEQLQNRFRSALEPYLIQSTVLLRPEPEKLVERIVAIGGARLLFVTGDAGSGKSGVLLDAMRLLDEQAVPYLPIRFDTHFPDRDVRAYSRERLGLPASPGVCLRTLAEGRRAVLIIDQLDAVRWTSANSDVAWELCKEIIDEALHFPNISVVVAGRTIDLYEDPRIKHWKKGIEVRQAIEVEPFSVGRLPEEVVASVIERYGVEYRSLEPRVSELFTNAQNLQLWWRLAEEGKIGTFSSRAELLGSYWGHYRDKAVHEFPGVTSDALNALLAQLIEFMDKHGRLDAPNLLLQQHREAAKALRSLGILDCTSGTTRFAHQSHLDYLTIERVFLRALRSEVVPIEWLRGHDQSLFRRDQVRFLLQLLRDQDHRLYLELLQDIFFGGGIRFHIQHLALTTLAHAAPPSDREHGFLKRLWNEVPWHVHVLERVLAVHPHWLDRLTDDGTIPAMLASGDETQRHEALFLCYRSADAAPLWFERVLAPHWDSEDSEWQERVGSRLSIDAEHDTPVVFQWRLARARLGADQHEIYRADSLAEKDPIRAISYFAAIAEGLVANVERAAAGDEQRRVDVDRDRFKNLHEACVAHPRLSWDCLLAVHARAVAVEEAIRRERTGTRYFVQDSARQIISLLHGFLTASGAATLQSQGSAFLAELKTLGQTQATVHARHLAVDVLSATPDSLADSAVACLLSVERSLDIEASAESMTQTDALSSQDPAIDAIRVLAVTCSEDALRSIEHAILSIHPDYERRSVERQRELIREGYWEGHPNLYGLSQYALLLALPENRLSDQGVQALRMWRDKFGELSQYRSAGPVKFLPVVSPIPSGRAKFVSDDTWLEIVRGRWNGRRRDWRETKDGTYVDTSPSSFAASLEEAGKLNPDRYIRLGLRFPENAREPYYSALLRVAAVTSRQNDADETWTAAPVNVVENLIEHIGDKWNTEIAKGICHVISERSGEAWSEATLSLLREYALHHPHPSRSSRMDSSEKQDDSRALAGTVLNSTRCSAILAASQLLWAHPDLLDWAKELASDVIQDSHPAVRAASFSLAHAIGRHDLEFALQLMVGAYDRTEDAVLGVLHGPHLISVLWKRDAELAPIFERALASSDPRTSELAAYWITVGNVLENLYTELAGQAADGTPASRVGVVRALVDIAHIRDDCRAECLDRLAGFIEDVDESVLDATDGIFRRDGFLETAEAPGFAKRFASSAAFRRDPSALLHQLKEFEGSLLPFAAAIETSVAQLAGPLANATQSFANRHGLVGGDIATILLRLYQQSEGACDANLKSHCLDQWDELLRARVGTGQDVLNRIDS